MALGPFSVKFPVDFRSGGDTTNQAFHKHMQEIIRIYDCLNALNADKLSASDLGSSLGDIGTNLTNHINSTNPHPYWKPSLSFSDITGTLDASKVVGKLSNATIDASKVNGLDTAISSKIPESKGEGITAGNLEENGYVKFNNGLIIQWGRVRLTKADFDSTGEVPRTVTFPIPFTLACFMVTVGTQVYTNDNVHAEIVAQSRDVTNIGFNFLCQNFYGSASNVWDSMYCNYIATGK